MTRYAYEDNPFRLDSGLVTKSKQLILWLIVNMKQTFIVTIDSEDKITSKEVAECLNNTVGGYSLNFGHDYAIVATVRKENKKKNSK